MPAQGPLIAARIGFGIVSGRVCGRRSWRASAIAELLQLLHVGARAETPAGAGHDDRAHVLARRALLEHPEIQLLHLRRPRVQPLGAVEREHGHSLIDRVLYDFAHLASFRDVRQATAEPLSCRARMLAKLAR